MLLLLACVSPIEVSPPSDAVLAALDGETDFDAFAVVLDESPVSLTDGGPAFPEDIVSFSAWGEHGVLETGNDVRIVASYAGIKLFPWVERSGLADLVARSTWVGADGHQVETGAPGVRVPGGTPVRVDEEGSWVHLDNWLVDADLLVADGLVDQAARRDEDPAERETDAVLEAGATLRDDDGRALVTLNGEGGAGVAPARVLRREVDRVLVEISLGEPVLCAPRPTWLARGWVRPSDLDPTSFGGGGGWSCCCGAGFGLAGVGSPWRVLEGTWLYDAPDGAPVGIAEADVMVELTDEGGGMPGWTSVSVPSAWGYGEVWAPAAGVTMAVDEEE